MSSSQPEFGELVLLIGDFHIPSRSPALAKEFKELLNTDKIRHVLCTGNIGCRETYEMLKSIAPNVHIVRGDMDVEMPDFPEPSSFPEYQVVTICGFRIGLIHGHQIIPWGSTDGLMRWQRKFSCDILVSGFTHQNTAEKVEGKVYINPGSATGAYKPVFTLQGPVEEPHCSFMLMAVQPEQNVVLYVYELRNGRVNVAMSEFSKDDHHETL